MSKPNEQPSGPPLASPPCSEFSPSDLQHDGYSEKYRSGEKCVECGKPAGTAWGPYFCPPCDIARKERISRQLEALCSPNTEASQPEGSAEK